MQRGNVNHRTDYSDKAQFTGKPSYLEPISQSLHGTIEGVYPALAENTESRSRIGVFRCQCHVETRVYLQRIRNRMHKPVEGRSRIGIHVNQKDAEKPQDEKANKANKKLTPFATLIPKDDILIFCESASKTALAKHAKPSKHATPCSQEHGVKGELNRLTSGFKMTPSTGNKKRRTLNIQKVFTKRQ